ncbi:hypothetical protein BHE74_00020153 [Ensete ventricosum]|nr:hypothetical protein BHE74_00020153 [Ensete ventricosum]
MGASANPSGNPDGANGGPLRAGGARGVSDEGGAGSSVPGNPSNGATPGPAQALKHNPGLSIEWSAEEQTILEEGLSKLKKENNKRRKEDHNLARKSKDKKLDTYHTDSYHLSLSQEKVTDSAKSSGHLGTRPNVPPYALPMLPVDEDDISYKGFDHSNVDVLRMLSCLFAAIGGRTGELLENNAETFTKISANFANLRVPAYAYSTF